MKRINYFFISLLLLLSLFSCEKDEATTTEDPITNSENINEEKTDIENSETDTPEPSSEEDKNNEDGDTPEDNKEESEEPKPTPPNTEDTPVKENEEQPTTPINNTDQIESSIVGNWKLVDYRVNNGKSTRTIGKLVIASNYTEISNNHTYDVNINANNSINTSGHFTYIRNTIRPTGNITQKITENSNIFGQSWMLDSNFLTITNRFSGVKTNYKIVEMTNTKMVLSFDLSQLSKENEVISGERFITLEKK
ncbi:hypothetical protein [Aquimarina agarilytica]|uniref:hypothetical protein n=1 Tax=Aquimarina agarilytica TaxID=1087449 RepID=UPI000288224D|nr:hypothetical protein [Aquimarina agarilytica]